MYRDGFHCPLAGEVMGRTAETLARAYGISREEQDAYALESQRRAAAARDAGKFLDEIVPVETAGRGGPALVETDEHLRPETTLASLAALDPVFASDGSVTAGNSSGITDAAAALVVVRRRVADDLGLAVLARVEASESAGVDPKIMGVGPVPAVKELFRRTGLSMNDMDVIELNEAFAAQVLAVDRELDLPRERMNPNGGAIALGHPIGASGARILVTLIHEMVRRKARRGLATLCVSGGLGLAVTLVREEKGEGA